MLYFSDFLPGAGPLVHLTTPPPSEDVRIETGVVQGEKNIEDKTTSQIVFINEYSFPLNIRDSVTPNRTS